MTVMKGNMIMLSDLMNTSGNADLWDGTTRQGCCATDSLLKNVSVAVTLQHPSSRPN